MEDEDMEMEETEAEDGEDEGEGPSFELEVEGGAGDAKTIGRKLKAVGAALEKSARTPYADRTPAMVERERNLVATREALIAEAARARLKRALTEAV